MGFFKSRKCKSKKRLDGKVVIVTGSNCGIGKYTALDLAKRGAEVIMACRSVERAEAAADEILHSVPEAKLKVMKLDLSCMASVRNFSREFMSSFNNLHFLVNNAGVMMCPFELTVDGFEKHFATNHLGHFLLSLLLLPMLIDSAPSRIINISSMAHRICSSLSLDDLNYEEGYSPIKAYARSKAANILFTLELARRLEGTDVIAVSLHPGVVDTELNRHLSESVFPGASWLYGLGWWIMKTPKQGAQTTLFCVLDDSVESGLYYDDCSVGVTTTMVKDVILAKQLWDKSIELLNLETYDPFSKITS